MTSTHDDKGHPWATFAALRKGDCLIAVGFDCLSDNEVITVEGEAPFFRCSCAHGNHALVPNAAGCLVGFYSSAPMLRTFKPPPTKSFHDPSLDADYARVGSYQQADWGQ